MRITVKALVEAAFVIAAGVIMIFSAGCAGKTEPFKIGVILQLSTSEKDRAEKVGAAVEESVSALNSKGGIRGRQVKVIIVNGMGEESETLLSAKRLMEIDYVHAVVCETGGGLTPAVPDAFERGRTPLIFFGAEAVPDKYLNEWVAMPGAGEPGDETGKLIKALDVAYSAIREGGQDKARIRKAVAKLAGGVNE